MFSLFATKRPHRNARTAYGTCITCVHLMFNCSTRRNMRASLDSKCKTGVQKILNVEPRNALTSLTAPSSALKRLKLFGSFQTWHNSGVLCWPLQFSNDISETSYIVQANPNDRRILQTCLLYVLHLFKRNASAAIIMCVPS